MYDHNSATGIRPVSEILAQARGLQAPHAPRAIGAARRWLRGAFARPSNEAGTVGDRRLPTH